MNDDEIIVCVMYFGDSVRDCSLQICLRFFVLHLLLSHQYHSKSLAYIDMSISLQIAIGLLELARMFECSTSVLCN